MCTLGANNDLILFDRGYPSQNFITLIESKNIKYLMRVNEKFFKAVINAPKANQVI
ncbi:hypothetical protein CBO05C_2257 [Clostridium botulinum B str. Osaka05]|uniref:Transposase IS4-like domain-containing protein n=1 Tax=Clostridium botulinum B str. Osaka05 TaxID=1407017 RepID=A0A0S6U8K5_CLOBO|nr:hypothetical protein CBO05C_2257 [Clostridium botulinum B str. Osaka05]